jgi:hypothetical protein
MKMRFLTTLLILTGIAFGFEIDWFTIDGGGGSSSGGGFTINGTIGQADAGAMSGGSYAIEGGFWSLPQVIQTPGAPPLNIGRNGTQAVLTWPAPSSGWQLQKSTDLILWNPATGTPAVINGNNTLNVPMTAGREYYRLHFP